MGLVRSYAIGLIPDTGLAAKSDDDDYEPATELVLKGPVLRTG